MKLDSSVGSCKAEVLVPLPRLWQKGWNATSVAAVISKVLISKTTQHRYFPHNLSHHY
jgi:hypothetical protein